MQGQRLGTLLVFVTFFLGTVLGTPAPTIDGNTTIPVKVKDGKRYNATVGDILSLEFDDGSLYQFYTLKAYDKCDFNKALKLSSDSPYLYEITANASNWYIVELYDIARGNYEQTGSGQQPPPQYPPDPLPGNITAPMIEGSFPLYFGTKSSLLNLCKKKYKKAIVDVYVENTPTLAPTALPTTAPPTTALPTEPPTPPPTRLPTVSPAEVNGTSAEGDADLVVGAGVAGGVAVLGAAAVATVLVRRNGGLKLRRTSFMSVAGLLSSGRSDRSSAGSLAKGDRGLSKATVVTGYTRDILGDKKDRDDYALSVYQSDITPSLARAVSLDSSDTGVAYAAPVEYESSRYQSGSLSSRFASTMSGLIFGFLSRPSLRKGDSRPTSFASQDVEDGPNRSAARRNTRRTKSSGPKRKKPRGATTSAEAYAMAGPPTNGEKRGKKPHAKKSKYDSSRMKKTKDSSSHEKKTKDSSSHEKKTKDSSSHEKKAKDASRGRQGSKERAAKPSRDPSHATQGAASSRGSRPSQRESRVPVRRVEASRSANSGDEYTRGSRPSQRESRVPGRRVEASKSANSGDEYTRGSRPSQRESRVPVRRVDASRSGNSGAEYSRGSRPSQRFPSSSRGVSTATGRGSRPSQVSNRHVRSPAGDTESAMVHKRHVRDNADSKRTDASRITWAV